MSPIIWIALAAMAGIIAAFAPMFRRVVVLFAALDASERMEDNRPVAPQRGLDDSVSVGQ